jgi:hypothetical protein
MRSFLIVLLAVSSAIPALSQTADELIAKNIEAKGGLEKIKALKTVRMTGTIELQGGFNGLVGQDNKRPNLVRETFTLQGLTAVQAYDGSTGWQIQPFGGHKDPELMGEDDVRDLLIDADFDGPLVDYKQKGNTVEYLVHDSVDGDDALRLKVTLKNGDIVYYYLDPDAYLEIRIERQEFVRGSVRESVANLGAYKPVEGVMFPFSVSTGPKNDPTQWQNVSYEKIEANITLPESDFAVPASLREAPKKTGNQKLIPPGFPISKEDFDDDCLRKLSPQTADFVAVLSAAIGFSPACFRPATSEV